MLNRLEHQRPITHLLQQPIDIPMPAILPQHGRIERLSRWIPHQAPAQRRAYACCLLLSQRPTSAQHLACAYSLLHSYCQVPRSPRRRYTRGYSCHSNAQSHAHLYHKPTGRSLPGRTDLGLRIRNPVFGDSCSAEFLERTR
jgi:hypothetical protein